MTSNTERIETTLREQAVIHLDDIYPPFERRVRELVTYEPAEPDVGIPNPLVVVVMDDGGTVALHDDGTVVFVTDNGDVDDFTVGTWNSAILDPPDISYDELEAQGAWDADGE